MITTHVTINLTSQVSPRLIQAVQGDTGRSICFKLADFTIPAGAAATYYIQKPSGEAIYNSATISGNEITCELTAQSLAEIGENPMQVRISADGEIVTSFDAILLVRPFRGIGAIESSTEINIFDQAVEQAAEDFQEQAEEIAEEVIESIPEDYTELTEEVEQLNERVDNIVPGLSAEAKLALLNCFANVAWANEDGESYYNALTIALNGVYPKITATYHPGLNIIYTDDSLNTLKQYITVIYYDDAESTGVVIEPSAYTLSGELLEGTNNIAVEYDNLSTIITIPDVVDFYNIWEWDSQFTGVGKLTRTPVRGLQVTYDGVPRKGILYDTSLIAGNNNRGFATLRGKAPMVTEDLVTLSEYYPIPIPATANKLTARITPTTQRLSPALFKYDPNDQTPAPYNRYSAPEWHTSEAIITFEASENLFLVFNCSINASFTQYTPETEPDMNVLFERS